MSYTQDDLASAIDKLGGIDLTDAEIEALTSILASTDDEVSGFGFDRSEKGWIIIQSFKASGWKVEEGESARWNIEQGSASKWNIEQGSAIRMTEGTL
jgi:hypothetical protein